MNKLYSANLSLAKAALRDRAGEQVLLPPMDGRAAAVSSRGCDGVAPGPSGCRAQRWLRPWGSKGP